MYQKNIKKNNILYVDKLTSIYLFYKFPLPIFTAM